MLAIPFQNHHASLAYYPLMPNGFDCMNLLFVLVSNIVDLMDLMLFSNGKNDCVNYCFVRNKNQFDV